MKNTKVSKSRAVRPPSVRAKAAAEKYAAPFPRPIKGPKGGPPYLNVGTALICLGRKHRGAKFELPPR